MPIVTSRRQFLSLFAAPAIVRAGNLMPVRAISRFLVSGPFYSVAMVDWGPRGDGTRKISVMHNTLPFTNMIGDFIEQDGERGLVFEAVV